MGKRKMGIPLYPRFPREGEAVFRVPPQYAPPSPSSPALLRVSPESVAEFVTSTDERRQEIQKKTKGSPATASHAGGVKAVSYTHLTLPTKA